MIFCDVCYQPVTGFAFRCTSSECAPITGADVLYDLCYIHYNEGKHSKNHPFRCNIPTGDIRSGSETLRYTGVTNTMHAVVHYITLSWLFTCTERFLPQGVIPCVTKQLVYILMLLLNHMVHLATALLVSFFIPHQSLGTKLVSRWMWGIFCMG